MEQTSQSRKSRRGQITMLDLVVSISIFMFLIAILYGAWQAKIDAAAEQMMQFRASVSAQKALLALTQSPGLPTNWAAQNLSPNSDSLKGIGTADFPNNIDQYKLEALEYYYNNTQTTNKTKQKLGLSPFSADIRIYYSNGTNISVMGDAPDSNSKIWATTQKAAVYKNDSVLVRVRLWE